MGTKLITLAIVKFCIQSTETSWVWDCSIMKYIIILYNAPGGPVDNDTFNSNISNIISAKSTSFSKFPTFFLSQCSPVLFSQYINLFYIEIDFYFVLRNFDCSCGKFDAVCRNTALPTHSYNNNNISQALT